MDPTPTVRLEKMKRGDPRTLVVAVVTPGHVPADLSGSSWACTVRRFPTSTDGTDLVVDESQLAAGVLSVTIPGEVSTEFGSTICGELEGTIFGTLLSFSAAIVPDVTRAFADQGGESIEHFYILWGGDGTRLVATESVRAILIRGNTGDTGPANSLDIGTVTTGSPGSPAGATITGEAPSQTLGLTIPRGDKGDKGDKGDLGNTGPPGDWSTAQTVRTVSGVSDTPTSADSGDLILCTSGSPVGITISGALDLAVGQRIDFVQMGAGQVTFTGSGATVNGTPTLKTRAQYSAASLLCVGTDTYVLVGDLAAF